MMPLGRPDPSFIGSFRQIRPLDSRSHAFYISQVLTSDTVSNDYQSLNLPLS